MRILTADTTRVSDRMLAGHTALLKPYLTTLVQARGDYTYRTPETALAAPSHTEALERTLTLADRYTAHVRTVLLVGIGGSDLGTRAVYEALVGHRARYGGDARAQLYVFGTVEPAVLSQVDLILAAHTDPREVVLVVVTKSGTTTETMVNGQVLYERLCNRFGAQAAAQQTVAIGDAESALAARAREEGMTHLALPHAIGGRYSVCTAVGLFPLALSGIDVRAFAEGAAAGARAAAPGEGNSSAAVLAGILYESYLTGITMHEFFVWHPELETLGKWYRQLLAESIGKHRADGTVVGMTPTVAVGSVDLHSHGQLVFGGPKSRVTTFVAAPRAWEDGAPLSASGVFSLPTFGGKTPGEVTRAIYDGVCATYRSHELPFVRVELEALNERELGACMAIHMATVMCFAKLLEVNAFDQPDVEAYKDATRRILAGNA